MRLSTTAAVFTLLIAAPLANAAAAAPETVPFVENDYTKALAAAKTKHLPLFVDAWAPW